MKKLIIGTTNQTKLRQIKTALGQIGIDIAGLPLNIKIQEVKEDCATAQENAKKKALAYSSALNETVLSMDNALYIDGLPENEQPGINVRRINNRTDRPTDEEILEYYQSLVEKLGGRVSCYWEFAVCIARPDGKTSEKTIILKRIFVSQKNKKILPDFPPGYPLESLQIDPTTGKYGSEISAKELEEYWQKNIGPGLREITEQIIK